MSETRLILRRQLRQSIRTLHNYLDTNDLALASDLKIEAGERHCEMMIHQSNESVFEIQFEIIEDVALKIHILFLTLFFYENSM